ncbi:MAG: UPF0175 family protein [Verrucomicrobiota bacterium]
MILSGADQLKLKLGAGRLTQRQVGAMLGLDYWQTETFLNERAVPLNYSAADLAADHATLERIISGP